MYFTTGPHATPPWGNRSTRLLRTARYRNPLSFETSRRHGVSCPRPILLTEALLRCCPVPPSCSPACGRVAVSEGRRTSQRHRPKAFDCLERTVGGIDPFGTSVPLVSGKPPTSRRCVLPHGRLSSARVHRKILGLPTSLGRTPRSSHEPNTVRARIRVSASGAPLPTGMPGRVWEFLAAARYTSSQPGIASEPNVSRGPSCLPR